MKAEVILKTVKYTFKLQKTCSGLNKICENHFVNPIGDGIEVGQLLDKLPEGHKITVIVTVTE